MTFPIIETEVTVNGIPTRLMHFEDPVVGSGLNNANHQWSNVLEYLKQAIRPGSRVIDAGGTLESLRLIAHWKKKGRDIEILEACLPLLKHDSAIVSQFSPYHLHRNGTTIKDVEMMVLGNIN